MAKKLPIQAALAAAKEEAKKDKKTSTAGAKANSAAAAEIAKKAGAQASALALGAGLHSTGTAARAKQALQSKLAAQAAATQGVPVRQGSITQMPTAAPGKNQFVTLPGTPQTGSLASNATLLNNTTAGPVNRNSAYMLEAEKLYSDTLKKLLADFNTYAGYGPQQKQEIADGLVSGAITGPGKGNAGALDWTAQRDMEVINAEIAQQMGASGTFDDPFYALNSQYVTLPSMPYMQGLLGEKEAELASWEEKYQQAQERQVAYGSGGNDGAINAFYSALQKSGALESGQYTPMQLLYIDSIVNRTEARPLSVFNSLSEAEREAELQRMQAVANSVNWDEVLNPQSIDFDAEEYKTQTARLNEEANTIRTEIDRRSRLQEMQTSVRSNPDYASLSGYQAPAYEIDPMYKDGGAKAAYAAGKANEEQWSNKQNFINNWRQYQSSIGHNAEGNSINEAIGDWFSGISNFFGTSEEDQGGLSTTVRGYISEGLQYMTSQEVADYNALMAIDPALADEYLDLTRPERLARKADAEAKYYATRAGDIVLGAVDSAASIPKNAWGTVNTVFGALSGETDPNAGIYGPSRQTQVTREEFGETLGEMFPVEIFGEKAGTIGYNILMSIGDMLFAKGIGGMAGAVTGKAGAAQKVMGWVMASESGAGTYLNDLQEGKDPLYAVLHGTANGAIETWSESGFIDTLFDEKGRFLTRVLKSGAAEGLEEVVAEGGQMGTDLFLSYLTGQENDIQKTFQYYEQTLGKDKAAMATLQHYANNFAIAYTSGFATGSGTSAVVNTGVEIDNRATGKSIQQQGDPEKLMEIAKSMPEGSEARAIAMDIEARVGKGKKPPLGKLGQMAKALDGELNKEYADITNGVIEDAIEQRLVELGTDQEAAKRNAVAIRKMVYGEKPTIKERAAVAWDDNADQVTKEIFREMRESETQVDGAPVAEPEGQRTGQKWVTDAKRAQIDAAGEVIGKQFRARAAAKTKNVSQTAKDAAAKGESKVRKGKDGKPVGKLNARKVYFDNGTSRGEGDILRFEEQEDGLKMIVQTGKTDKETTAVGLDALTEADGAGTAGIIEAVQDINETLHPVSAEEANAMLAGYDAVGGDAATFVENYERAYLAGYSGMDTQPVALDPGLAKIAKESGARQAEKDEAKRKERASAYKAVSNPVASWLGKVTNNTEVRGRGDADGLGKALEAMTESQRMTAEAAVEFGKAVGLNVVLYESDANHISSIKNGSFEESTHTVYLDVNSGAGSAQDIQAQKDSGTLGYAIMRTLGHEVTHYLEVASPEMYGKYKAAIKAGLKAAGEDVAQLIRGKLDNALNEGRKLTYAAAEAEVIADASEYMLQDSKFTGNLDNTLRGKVKTFVQNFMQKVKEIFGNLTTAHRESKALREMVDGVYRYTGKLQELWDASLQEVLDKGTSDRSGGVTEMVEEQAVKYSTRYVDNQPVVWVEENILANKPETQSDKAYIKDYLISHIDDVYTIIESGSKVYPAKQLPQEYLYSNSTKNLERYNRKLFKSKLKMVEGIGEMVEIATNRRWEKTRHEHNKNAKYGVYRYDTRVAFQGVTVPEAYTAELVILNADDGKKYLYDIVNIKKDSVTAKGLLDKARGANEFAQQTNAVNNSVPQSDENVNPERKFSTRDLPADVSVRDYLAELKPTDRINETEKFLLKRYQDTLGKLREAEKKVAEQDEIIKTAPFRNPDGSLNDELTKAKNRWQIYRNQANRYARELGRAERNEGFAGLMATGQKLVNQYLTGGYNRIADAQDALETEIRSLGEQLKTIGKTVETAEQGQKTAHARGLFNQGELNAAAKHLKDSYGSRMSIKEISNRLALAYGEIYASNGAEGAKRFTDAAKDLAQDIMASSKYRYRSETLTMIAEEIPTISLTETDKQEIKNAGLTITEYKRGISPFVKVVDGASDLSSYVSNAEAYGGQIVNILGTDTEGDLAMALYNVIQAEKQAEGAGTFEGMTEGESLSAVMVDIMSANLPMTTNSSTLEYLREEMLKYAGESQAAAEAVEGAIQSVKNATKRASTLWHRAVQEVELSERAIDYYRALEEQRRLMELQDQKKELTEQLKSDAAKKIHEQVEKQRAEYREREQRAREYRKTRDEVDKMRRGIGRKVKRLNALRVRETDQKHVPQELQHVADLVMQTFTDSSLGRLAFSQERLNSLSHRYQMLKELESDSTYFWDDEIEMDITNLQALGEAYSALRNREGDVPSRFSLEGVELETEILQGVDAIVSNVMQMIDSANDAFLTQRNETFDQFATQTGEKLLAHDDHKVLKGWRGKLQELLDETIRTGNMTPIYFFEHLQNQELLDVFNELRIGQNYYAQIVAEGKDFVQAAKEKHNYGKWVADGKLKMKTGQGHVIELTREEAVEIYAIAKREQQNKLYQTEHLLYGGFQYKNIQDKVSEDGKTQQTDKPHQLDKADIARISEWLTAEQKAYADELVGFLSTTMADYGNAASMDMYGYRKFTEQYYIPFHVVQNQRPLKGDEGPQGENAGTGRVKSSGFTKKVQHGAKTALYVGGLTDTVADHIHKMAAYSAMVQPIENMKRLLNHKVLESDGTVNTVRALIGQKYGQASEDYLTQLLKDANGATMGDQRASKGFNWLIGAFKRGAVMASASVVLQQPTAAARAMAYISPKYFAQNPFYRPSKGTWDEMMKYSGTAVIKDMGKFDVGMGLTASQYIADENINMFEAYQRLKADSKTKAGKAAYDRFMAWLTAAPGKADQWTWGLIWKAVKAEQAALHPKMDVNSEAFLQMCGARFDDVIDHTQVYDSVLTRSNLMRSTNALHKMATSFMSEPSLSLNMLYDAITGKHGKKQGARIIGSVVASQVLAGALAALVQAWNDDDDERNWLEKYADRATGNILDNINVLGMIPYVSDIVSLFEGYEVERPDMSVIADIYDYSKTFFKAFEDGGTPSWKQIENFAGTLANLVGVPAKNISREIRRTRNAIWNTKWDSPNAFNVGHAMLENAFWYSEKNTAYYQRMVTAHLNGDTELEADFRTYMLTSKMVSEESMMNGLQTAMQERYLDGDVDDDTAIKYLVQIGKADDEEEAYWTVDKWQYMKETGNTAQSYRKYDEFFAAVESGANLKATIQNYLDNGVSKTTLATQITNQYKKQLIALKQSGKGYADLQARLLTAYEALGYDRNKKLKDIQKWFEED